MNETVFNIAAVERETGIGKDTLRVWERRYGFPQPERDGLGERLYSGEQVERLMLIKRLLDAGARPGNTVPHPVAELHRRLDALGGQAAVDPVVRQGFAHIERHDAAGLQRWLAEGLGESGLAGTVIERVAPLTAEVGAAWARRELSIAAEHFYSEQMRRLLAAAVVARAPAGPPGVLVTTTPGETHALGILMVEAVLAEHGVACAALGTETPLEEIAAATARHRVRAVALSFSSMRTSKSVRDVLTALRGALPESIALWAGGSGVHRLRRPPAGVSVSESLEDLPDLWRSAAQSA